jgi:hypothetical protein
MRASTTLTIVIIGALEPPTSPIQQRCQGASHRNASIALCLPLSWNEPQSWLGHCTVKLQGARMNRDELEGEIHAVKGRGKQAAGKLGGVK